MKNTIKVLVLVFISLAFVFCSAKNDKEARQKQITDYENAINNAPQEIDAKKADSLITLYNNYVKDFPKDSLCADYLFRTSQIYGNLKDCNNALKYLDRIIKEYPKGNRVGAAYFFKGVMLQDVCLNKEEAIKAFNIYIQKFPNSKQVNTAKMMIQMDTMQNESNEIKLLEKKSGEERKNYE
jgi:TolA-binding protein